MSELAFSYSAKFNCFLIVSADARLTRACVAVFGVLAHHANRTNGLTYPSITTITKISGVSRSGVIRSLKRLEDCSWIRSEKRVGAHSNYWLTGVTPGTSSAAETGVIPARTGINRNLRVGNTSSGNDTKAVPAMTPEQRKSFKATENQQAEMSGPPGFARFWNAYPRKEERAKAALIWKTLDLEALADEIVDDVTSRVADPGNWTVTRYIPHPGKYLSNRRWEQQAPERPERPQKSLPRDDRSEREIDEANQASVHLMMSDDE